MRNNTTRFVETFCRVGWVGSLTVLACSSALASSVSAVSAVSSEAPISSAPAVSAVSAVATADLSGIDVGELGKVQSQTILLKALAERAKAEQESQAGSPAMPQAANRGFEGLLPPSLPAARPDQLGLPVIKMVSGSAQTLRATLLYRGGLEVDALAGRDVPGGYRVIQVSLDGVTLERQGQRYPLGFSGQAPVASQEASATMLPGQLPAPAFPSQPPQPIQP